MKGRAYIFRIFLVILVTAFLFSTTSGFGQTLTTLYTFSATTTNSSGFAVNSDGAMPEAPLIQTSDGTLYGTTYSGGLNGSGTVFKIPSGGTLTPLYTFSATTTNASSLQVNNDGSDPMAGLVLGTDGNFYGTTFNGGTNGHGTVFKLTTSGSLTNIHNFTGTDGQNPEMRLIQSTVDGNFYGVTSSTSSGYGTAFNITSGGALAVLHTFNGTTDGGFSWSGLVQGSDGNFYGTTEVGGAHSQGTFYQLTSGGTLTAIQSFTSAQSNEAWGPLVQGTDGLYYGTSREGGSAFCGTVFKVTSTGAVTVLHTFTTTAPSPNGADPYGGVIQASDGNFYGTTYDGGTNGSGTIFEITSAGTLTTLHSFASSTEGANPYSGLVQGSDGNFYGTTSDGGANGNGTVFKLSVSGSLKVTISPTAAITAGAKWQVDGGALQSSGTTLSGLAIGPHTVTFSGPFTGWNPPASQNIIVTTNQTTSVSGTYTAATSPTVATAAAANPNPVTSTTTNLTVLGADAGGESNLTYTWATTGTPPGPVVFSANQTNAAKSTTASFTSPGTYNFTVTITNLSNLSTTSSVQVVVDQNYNLWTLQNGLTGNGALETTVIANDGLNNLFKYALGLTPTTNYNPGSTGLPYVAIQNVSGTNYLMLTFDGIATDVTYTVQATSNLAAGWSTIQTFSSGGTAPGTQTVQDSQAVSASSQRFMRLLMTIP
jgi:uncharacterized repeat protein (TIGR03803 family)